MTHLNERLIECVRAHECLYNKRSVGYKNVIKKTKIWQDIGNKFDISGEECSKKWESLRDRYTSELKKLDGMSSTGTESQQYDFSQWEYMEALSFLKEFNKPRKTSSNMPASSIPLDPQPSTSADNSVASISDLDESSVGNSSQRTPNLHKIKNKGLLEINAAFIQATNAFKEAVATKKEPSEDAKFGQAVGLLISNIEDPLLKKQAKAKIFQYLSKLNADQYSQ